jgi:xylulokinase
MSYIPGAQGAPLGDAILAGMGTGVIRDHRVIEEWLGEKVPVEPDRARSEEYARFYDLYRRSLEAAKPVFEAMTGD